MEENKVKSKELNLTKLNYIEYDGENEKKNETENLELQILSTHSKEMGLTTDFR